MPRSDAFDDLIKDALHTDSITRIGGGSGDISVGVSYRTKEGQEVFVKLNEKSDVSYDESCHFLVYNLRTLLAVQN